MKKRIITASVLILIVIIVAASEFLNILETGLDYTPEGDALITLYGETHGSGAFYKKELEEWQRFYKSGCRHLFVELPYYTAGYLNMWMKADNDDIINQIFEDIRGTQSDTPEYLEFFGSIKSECPETVFHGTDVGHQYDTTGARYLADLAAMGLEDSLEYKRAKYCVDMGSAYRSMDDADAAAYRERMMVRNFLDAYWELDCGKVMGIYGSYHTNMTNPLVMSSRLKDELEDIVECRHVIKMLKKGPFSPGICVAGIIFLLMLFIPNILWIKRRPEGYDEYAKHENRFLGILEKTGEVGAVALLAAFRDFDPFIVTGKNGTYISCLNLELVLIFVLMILYEIYWIRYFKSGRRMSDFYRGICGIPLAGASIPCICLFIFAVYGRNIAMAAVALAMSIGHIGIHYMHSKEAAAEIRNTEAAADAPAGL